MYSEIMKEGRRQEKAGEGRWKGGEYINRSSRKQSVYTSAIAKGIIVGVSERPPYPDY